MPLIPFDEWAPYEDEIARVFLDFMRRKGRATGSAAAAGA